MNSDLVSKLPETYEERVALLNIILKTSMERLASESKKRNILHEPFGRPPSPTPLLTEEELIRRGGFSENSEDDVPVFDYEYGFNPLTYLGNLLEWGHPNSVAARNQVILESQRRLSSRARHAQNQMKTVETLKNSFTRYYSGLYWGPIVYPINKCEVAIACRVVREGDLIVNVSRSESYLPVERQIIYPVSKSDSTVRVVVNDLVPGVRYFVRCCLKDKNYDDPDFPLVEEQVVVENTNRKSMIDTKLTLPNKNTPSGAASPPVEEDETPAHLRPSARFTGLESNHWQTGEFWTLQSEDPNFEEETPSVMEEDVVGSPKLNSSGVATPADDADMEELDIVTVCKAFTFVAIGFSAVVHEGRHTNTKAFPKTKTDDHAKEMESKIEAARILQQLRALVPDCRFKNTNFNEFTPQLTEKILYSLFVGSNREIDEMPSISSKMKFCFPDAEPKSVKTIQDAADQVPVYGCLLGDIFNSAIRVHEESSLGSNGLLQDALWRLAVSSGVFCNTLSIFRKATIVVGWNDGSIGAKSGLRAEEVLHKQYSHDTRRYQRKYKLDKKNNTKDGSSGAGLPPPPTLVRPPASFSLDTLSSGMGIQLRDEIASARCLFHRYMLGPIVEVYVLDNRNGYLGAEQAKWFRNALEKSTAPWKFILNGTPFGVRSVAPFTENQLNNHISKVKSELAMKHNSNISLDGDGSDCESVGGDSVDSGFAPPSEAVDYGEKGNAMAEKMAARDKKKALKREEDAKDSNEYTLTFILQNIKLATDAPSTNTVPVKVAEEEEVGLEEELGLDIEILDPSSGGTGNGGEQCLDFDSGINPNEGNEPLDESLVTVESGIVVLTAGLDVPFIAAYDLKKNKGKGNNSSNVYCVEVGVGTMSLATQQQRIAELAMAPYTPPSEETNPVLKNIHTDMPHGFDIQKKLEDIEVTLLYGTFMNEFNYYPLTAIQNKIIGPAHNSLMESAASFSIIETIAKKEQDDLTEAVSNTSLTSSTSANGNGNGGTMSRPTTPTNANSNTNINTHSTPRMVTPRKNSNSDSDVVDVISNLILTDVISESMVNITPPAGCHTGPSSCALHLHTDGTLTILLSNLQTNEKLTSCDFTSTVLVNSLETFSANGSMSSRSKT